MNAYSGLQSRKPAIQVLTLSLQGETYAIEARHVREILDPVPVTDVPGAPRELNGLINVRGKVVPLVDLCLKLGMRASPQSIDSRFIVTEARIDGTQAMVGLRADRVYEMAEIAGDALEDTPQIGMSVSGAFVRCIGKRAGEFVAVLDLDAILQARQGKTVSSERRQRKRLKVSLPCNIDIGGQTMQGTIADISEDGALITGLASRPQASSGQVRIEGVPESQSFRLVDFSNGALRMAFEPAATQALSVLVQLLAEATGGLNQITQGRQH